jgi:tRNA(fMet)-specific endonuclease VapC
MTALHILDTDHVSLSQREYPTVLRRMAEIDRSSLAITIITVEEQIKGRFKLIKRAASSGRKLIQAYRDLQANLAFFKTIQVLPFDEAALAHYETLRQQKIRIGTQDLRIAAIVLSVKGTLVTRNWRDFSKIPNLVLEDWS